MESKEIKECNVNSICSHFGSGWEMLHLELVVASPPVLPRRRDSMLSRFAAGDTACLERGDSAAKRRRRLWPTRLSRPPGNRFLLTVVVVVVIVVVVAQDIIIAHQLPVSIV